MAEAPERRLRSVMLIVSRNSSWQAIMRWPWSEF